MIKWWYNRWILTGQMLTFGFVWACLVNNSNGESVTFGMKTIMNWWYRYTVCPIFRHHIFCLPWGTVEIEWIDASLLAWTLWTMWEPKCRIGNSRWVPNLKSSLWPQHPHGKLVKTATALGDDVIYMHFYTTKSPRSLVVQFVFYMSSLHCRCH